MQVTPFPLSLLKQATVIELDPRGFKVLQLANGNILKLFRLRHQWSLARWVGYAQRFCRNASKLQKKGIPTVQIVACYAIPDESIFNGLPSPITFKTPANQQTYAVEYAPLQGQTLKARLQAQQLTEAEVKQLGGFVAQLHAQGVHFRSLHLGNIVLTPNGEMGLIDIADMRIYPWALWFNTRLRSFRHVTRYAKLNQAFGPYFWHVLIQSYIQHANLSAKLEHRYEKVMAAFLQTPPH
jgi:hypothetical protein